MKFHALLSIIIACGFFLTGCAETKKEDKLVLQPASFADLPGWPGDKPEDAALAFAKSCARILKAAPTQKFSSDSWTGTYGDWQEACRAVPLNASDARAFFENNFSVFSVTDNGEATGLFTGYYEASLRGSLVKTGAYQIPLRARPKDLVMVDLGQFRDDLKGKRIAGRVIDGALKPYEDRAAIEDGRLPSASDIPLLYVDSAVDAFFLEVQGSGVVTLPDGTTRQVGYDGQNGYPYTAIGKELIKRGALTKGNVSMQSIRDWLTTHPQEGRDVMRVNRSYVFFKFTDDGPKGAEGVQLTAGRSLAVDHKFIPYGAPLYLSTQTPAYQQMMVAQDTGGAITGPVRGDMFFGYGDDARERAGPLQAKGRYWILLPKRIKPPGIE